MGLSRRNVIEVDGFSIIVQSCDGEQAHIGVLETGGKSVYYHVDLPSLTRQYKEERPGHLSRVQFDCMMEAHRAAILAKIDELNKPTPVGSSPEICACGGKVAHVLIDGVTEIARLCRPCFEQYLKDRHAANKPIAVGWARELGLRVTACANCESGIPNPDNFIGGRAVCNQKCGTELLAKMPRIPERTFPPSGNVTQLPLSLIYKGPKQP